MAGGGSVTNLAPIKGTGFVSANDSLHAISVGVRGVSTQVTTLAIQGGFAYTGIVTAVPGANQFTIPTLANLGVTSFKTWGAYVIWKGTGTGGLPQGTTRAVTAYIATNGTFTTGAFGAAIAAGDIIGLIHPALMQPPADTPTGSPFAVNAIGNAQDSPVFNTGTTASSNIQLAKGTQRALQGQFTRTTFTLIAGGAEQEVYNILGFSPAEMMEIIFDFTNLTKNVNVNIYQKIDAANYRLISNSLWTFGVTSVGFAPPCHLFANLQASLSIRLQSPIDEGVNRVIPYFAMERRYF